MNYAVLANARKSAPFDGTFNDVNDLAVFNSVDNTAPKVSQLSVLKNEFLTLTASAKLRLDLGLTGADNQTQLNVNVIAKWKSAIDRADNADPATPIDLQLVSAYGNPVADNVMTQAEYNALFIRSQYVYETKGGLPFGTILTLDDMARSHL